MSEELVEIGVQEAPVGEILLDSLKILFERASEGGGKYGELVGYTFALHYEGGTIQIKGTNMGDAE